MERIIMQVEFEKVGETTTPIQQCFFVAQWSKTKKLWYHITDVKIQLHNTNINFPGFFFCDKKSRQ